jgi:hypothetical protein
MTHIRQGLKDLDGAIDGVDEALFEGLANFDGASDGNRDWISEGTDKDEGSSIDYMEGFLDNVLEGVDDLDNATDSTDVEGAALRVQQILMFLWMALRNRSLNAQMMMWVPAGSEKILWIIYLKLSRNLMVLPMALM